ncbi:hypothetical protein GCM10028801_44720 [Nocardioides maradonensis]
MAQVHRSARRDAAITWRLSAEQKAALERDAKELGISMQTLLDRIVLGVHDAKDLRPGPSPDRELFSMTG